MRAYSKWRGVNFSNSTRNVQFRRKCWWWRHSDLEINEKEQDPNSQDESTESHKLLNQNLNDLFRYVNLF